MKYGDEFKLCYVDGAWAWFTTLDVQAQWGDDWNDAPYEHNAGTPYYYSEQVYQVGVGMVQNPKPRYELVAVPFDAAYLVTPHGNYGNSSYSVQDINAGAVAWLAGKRDDGTYAHIWAGTSYPEFVRAIQRAGGNVYEPIPFIKDGES